MHSHMLPDGKVVTHSHPFHKSGENVPEKSHSHSALYEFEFIGNLDISFLVTEIFHIDKPHRACMSIGMPQQSIVFTDSFFNDRGRSPPNGLIV